MRRLGAVLGAALGLAAWPGGTGAQTLYWIDTNYAAPTLNRSDAFGGYHTSIALTPGSLPEGLTFDTGSSKLYWVESAWTGARLMQANDNLSGVSQVLGGESCGRGIAVDPTTHKIYFTTSNLAFGPSLRVVNSDGSGEQIVLPMTGAMNPRGVALDAASGVAYWADFDMNQINRTVISSHNNTPIVLLPTNAGPCGIVFDPASNYVYWAQYNDGTIRRSLGGGGGANPVFSGLDNPTYLALDAANNRMFWIEAAVGGQKIRSGNLGGGPPLDLPVVITTFGGIALKPGTFTGVGDDGGAAPPTEFALDPVSPNPARGEATIGYALPREATVRLSVLDVSGRVVTTLVDGSMPAGRHAATWNGTGANGRAVASGLYFVRFQAAGKAWSRRVVRAR